MNAAQIKTMWDKDPNAVAKAFTATLKDFGYATLTEEYVKGLIEKLVKGEAPTGAIGMFLNKWLKDGIDDDD